jgi:ABC-type multidrug transport system ATPase subunit
MAYAWIIGAAEACDIRQTSPYVSGKHCRLEYADGRWTLEDLGSRNGTFVNGVLLQGRTPITRNDAITLGRTVPFPWPPTPDAPAAQPKSLVLPPSGEAIIVGRGLACDVVLDFPMVSTRHARIEHLEDGWVVEDLASTNGTFVRGQRIDGRVTVQPGDVVGLGSYQLRLSVDGQRLLEQDRRDALSVEVAHISVATQGKRLLEDVSLVARHGELIGIMGISGAGKSTLLATLVGYQQPTEGRVLMSGVDLHERFDELRGQVGYVPQDDIMHPELTVWQSLWYSARLRLPRDYSNEEIRERITRVIVQLGLEGTESTRIGDANRRGISGGQRKRVNVAMELITDPPVLVLDEPTSGLSSVDALMLMKVLRSLADGGKTVILTIHQPGLESLKLFDAVAVLAKDESTAHVGTLVWYGPAIPDAGDFFASAAGRDAGARDADAILRGLERRPALAWRDDYRSSSQHERWIAKRLSDPGSVISGAGVRAVPVVDALWQGSTLVQRMLAVKFADAWNSTILLLQAPLLGLLIAGVFGMRTRQVVGPTTWGSVSTAVGMTTFLLALAAVWCGVSNATREIVAERSIYRRERMVGLSRVAYLGSKAIVLAALCLVQCVVLFFAVKFGCALTGNSLVALSAMVLTALAGMAIGLVISASSRSADAAAAALPLVILPMVVLGGSLLPLADLPTPAAYLADLMPSRWGFETLVCDEAAARPPAEFSTPAGIQRQDMADAWFPKQGWRARRFVPLLILAGLTTLGLYTAHAVLVMSDRAGRRRLTG